MDFIFRVLCALIVSVSLQSTVSAASRRTEDSSNVWEKRMRTSLNLLQRRPCWGLSEEAECHDRAIFSNPDTQKMRLYTVAGPKKVRVVLPDRKQRRLAHHSSRNNSYDAVFVIDPFPEASFGHLVFLFLVSYDVNETTCNKTLNGAYIFTGKWFIFWSVWSKTHQSAFPLQSSTGPIEKVVMYQLIKFLGANHQFFLFVSGLKCWFVLELWNCYDFICLLL